jgi:hypothetical protein
MLDWLYDILISIVTFIIGLLGFDLKKKEVRFSNEAKDEIEKKEVDILTNDSNAKEELVLEKPIE